MDSLPHAHWETSRWEDLPPDPANRVALDEVLTEWQQLAAPPAICPRCQRTGQHAADCRLPWLQLQATPEAVEEGH